MSCPVYGIEWAATRAERVTAQLEEEQNILVGPAAGARHMRPSRSSLIGQQFRGRGRDLKARLHPGRRCVSARRSAAAPQLRAMRFGGRNPRRHMEPTGNHAVSEEPPRCGGVPGRRDAGEPGGAGQIPEQIRRRPRKTPSPTHPRLWRCPPDITTRPRPLG